MERGLARRRLEWGVVIISARALRSVRLVSPGFLIHFLPTHALLRFLLLLLLLSFPLLPPYNRISSSLLLFQLYYSLLLSSAVCDSFHLGLPWRRLDDDVIRNGTFFSFFLFFFIPSLRRLFFFGKIFLGKEKKKQLKLKKREIVPHSQLTNTGPVTQHTDEWKGRNWRQTLFSFLFFFFCSKGLPRNHLWWWKISNH